MEDVANRRRLPLASSSCGNAAGVQFGRDLAERLCSGGLRPADGRHERGGVSVGHCHAAGVDVGAGLREAEIAENGAVTRTEFGRAKIVGPNSDSRCGVSSPRPKRFVSEDTERAAGCEMTLDVESVLHGGVNRQEALG